MKVGENPKMLDLQCGGSIKTYARGNNDAPSITKYGSPLRLDAQIVALRAHCAKGAPKAILGATEGCRKKAKIEHFSSVTNQPMHQQFWGFRGSHGTSYIGLAATTWVLTGAQVPVLSPNDHPISS